MKRFSAIVFGALFVLFLLNIVNGNVYSHRPRSAPSRAALGQSIESGHPAGRPQRKHLAAVRVEEASVEKGNDATRESFGDRSTPWEDKKVVTGEPIPQNARNLEEFMLELKEVAELRRIEKRPIEYVFNETSFLLSCQGDWMEFGVADGKTVSLAGRWRLQHCGPEAKVHGFDTFTGLPEPWVLDGKEATFLPGTFSRNGQLPDVPSNVVLHKGLFIETLPGLLASQRAQRRRAGQGDPGVTYMHVDCDLYTGAAQALQLNAPRMRPGTVLIFDELVNYPNYREHEAKALWEWLAATGLRLRVIAIWGASPEEAILLDPPPHLPPLVQNIAFLVTE